MMAPPSVRMAQRRENDAVSDVLTMRSWTKQD